MSLFSPVLASPSSALFAPLASPVNSRQVQRPETTRRALYVTSRLDLLELPSHGFGLWVGLQDVWYRKLDIPAFLWLRERLASVYASEDDVLEAQGKLEFIRETGIRLGTFTERQIDERLKAPRFFDWREGFPFWISRSKGRRYGCV
jgi:hypothetical protein